MKTKYIIAICALILLMAGYWIKCQMGFNILEPYSMSNFMPFKYLQRNDVISVPEPGILLSDSFETRPIISSWSNLWMRDEGKVTLSYDSHGINNSRCLLVKNSGTKSLSYSHNKHVEVLEGDIFSFEGFVKIEGDNISAYVGFAAFDKHKDPIAWNYVSEKVDTTEEWIKVKNRFTIPDSILKPIWFSVLLETKSWLQLYSLNFISDFIRNPL